MEKGSDKSSGPFFVWQFIIAICRYFTVQYAQYGVIDLKESGTSGIEIGANGTKTGTRKFKVLESLRENKKETAKPYIHCFAVPNKKIGVTGFEPATSTSRTAYPIFNADLGCFINFSQTAENRGILKM